MPLLVFRLSSGFATCSIRQWRNASCKVRLFFCGWKQCIELAKMLSAKPGKEINTSGQKDDGKDCTQRPDMRRWRIVRQVKAAKQIERNDDRRRCPRRQHEIARKDIPLPHKI